MNSGLGLTPKRLQMEAVASGEGASPQGRPGNKGGAPFTTMTDHKSNHLHGARGSMQHKVPPILLANENKMKYVGGAKNQTQVIGNKRDGLSP